MDPQLGPAVLERGMSAGERDEIGWSEVPDEEEELRRRNKSEEEEGNRLA